MAQLSFLSNTPKNIIDADTQGLIDKLTAQGYDFIHFIYHSAYRIWVLRGPDATQHLIGDTEISRYLAEPPVRVVYKFVENN